MSASDPGGSDEPAHARFEVYEVGRKYWLRLVGAQGDPLLFGGPYARLEDAHAAIAQIKDASASYRTRMSAAGLFYFVVQSHDGTVLATARSHQFPADRDDVLAAALELAPRAPVWHQTS
jgi:hypothetical protein